MSQEKERIKKGSSFPSPLLVITPRGFCSPCPIVRNGQVLAIVEIYYRRDEKHSFDDIFLNIDERVKIIEPKDLKDDVTT